MSAVSSDKKSSLTGNINAADRSSGVYVRMPTSPRPAANRIQSQNGRSPPCVNRAQKRGAMAVNTQRAAAGPKPAITSPKPKLTDVSRRIEVIYAGNSRASNAKPVFVYDKKPSTVLKDTYRLSDGNGRISGTADTGMALLKDQVVSPSAARRRMTVAEAKRRSEGKAKDTRVHPRRELYSGCYLNVSTQAPSATRDSSPTYVRTPATVTVSRSKSDVFEQPSRPVSGVNLTRRRSDGKQHQDARNYMMTSYVPTALTTTTTFQPESPPRSSFIDPNDSDNVVIYESLGDVQTLMKPASKEGEPIYSLPQPQCYGEDTIRAMKAITEKYDTNQRRRLHAQSFRDETVSERKASDTRTIIDTTDVLTSGDNTAETSAVGCRPGGVQPDDVSRIELFYGSRGTDVTVCRCLADVSLVADGADTDVSASQVGVPVLLLNTGSGKRHRQLCIIVAERETGFPLWQDTVSYLTDYTIVDASTHTLRPSTHLRQLVRLRFYCNTAASQFHTRLSSITSDPNDALWRVNGEPNESRKSSRKSSRSAAKRDISLPCNFTHVTKLDPGANVGIVNRISGLVSKHLPIRGGKSDVD